MTKVKKNTKIISPVTPGELLLEEFLKPLGLTKYRLAKEIAVPPQRIGDIVAGKRSVSVDTDLRLCKYFGLTPGYWLRVQAAYDIAMEQARIADSIERIVPYNSTAMPAK
ncbi:MAG: HigA family addiction module antidote protein [Clostridiales Family XIII bacterium]|jgi:addiction module HigA family antidote|nr:HigA family addiction module antidote protein [Clostridiales Family XIII bacterium]